MVDLRYRPRTLAFYDRTYNDGLVDWLTRATRDAIRGDMLVLGWQEIQPAGRWWGRG